LSIEIHSPTEPFALYRKTTKINGTVLALSPGKNHTKSQSASCMQVRGRIEIKSNKYECTIDQELACTAA